MINEEHTHKVIWIWIILLFVIVIRLDYGYHILSIQNDEFTHNPNDKYVRFDFNETQIKMFNEVGELINNNSSKLIPELSTYQFMFKIFNVSFKTICVEYEGGKVRIANLYEIYFPNPYYVHYSRNSQLNCYDITEETNLLKIDNIYDGLKNNSIIKITLWENENGN